MSVAVDQFDTEHLAIDLRTKRSWRSIKSHVMVSLMFLAFIVILIPLIAVIGTVVSKGAGIVFRDFPAWFTKGIPGRTRVVGPGMGPAIIGTLVITGAASLLAIPLGILGAVYLHEYGRQSKPAKVVRFLANVMTGVPSIVMGLFIYVVFTLRFGLSGLGGALALASDISSPIAVKEHQGSPHTPRHKRQLDPYLPSLAPTLLDLGHDLRSARCATLQHHHHWSQ